ncbi:MAG: hypothetical protein ACFE85_12490 [Candidatus Hodarchaeota archaeon]
MTEEQVICKECILLDGFLGISINPETGLCSYCEDPNYKTVNWWKTTITDEMHQKALQDWNSVIQKMQSTSGKKKYDCIVGYSGGKDSTALLYTIVNDYHLNPLAITVDTGFVPETAFENVRDTLEKIKVDHVIIDAAQETFTKLYRYLFSNIGVNELCLTRNLCDNCGDLVHSLVVREAINRNIDLILFGYSPDEIRRYFYEIPQHEFTYDWMPSFMHDDLFTENDRKFYLNGQKISFLPRILLPYHVIDYQESKIIELIESKGLVKKGNSSTLKTSCHVIAAALFCDLNRHGGVPYSLQFAELIRQDPSIRKKWFITLKQLTPLIKEGKFNEKGVTIALEKMGIAKETLLAHIQNQVEQDSNKDTIIRNLNYFNKTNFKNK